MEESQHAPVNIQRRLAELGLDPGPIDGIIGKKTKSTLKVFQRLHGLKPDGIVGDKTLAELWPEAMPDRDEEPADAQPTLAKPIWPRQREVPRFFGGVGQHQTMLVLPYPMKLAWKKSVTVMKFSIHEKVHDSAKRCFERIADAYSPPKRHALGIDLFGGCLNVRPMRGGTQYSMHSWGIAIDFDPARNQLRWGKDRAHLAKPEAVKFWQIWEDEGWVSLGRTRNYDWMHVQAARL